MGASPLRNESDEAASHGEALSAWIDGELEQRDAEALLDRLRTDEALRERFDSIHWVGDALRSHEVAACHRPDLARSVSLALQAEPALLAPRALSSSHAWRRHAATGVTLAAAAAVLAVVVLPQLRGAQGGAPVPAEQVAAAVSRAPARAAPAATVAAVTPRDARLLEAYFRAHREMAPQGVMPEAVAYIRAGGEPDR